MPYAAAASTHAPLYPGSSLTPHGQALLSDPSQPRAGFFPQPPLQEAQSATATAFRGRDAGSSASAAAYGNLQATMWSNWMLSAVAYGNWQATMWSNWMRAAAAYGNWQATMWSNGTAALPASPSRWSSSQPHTPAPKPERPVIKVRHEPCWPDGEDLTCGGRLRSPIPKVNGKNLTLFCCPRKGGRLLTRKQATCGWSAASGTVISGTGRAGTTFLMAVLSDLGLPTGYDSADADQAIATDWHAGLELKTLESCYCAHDNSSLCIDWNTGVEIYKSPALAEQAQHPLWLSLPQNANLADVILPVRDHDAAAASRAANGLQNGGWTDGVRTVDEQRAAIDRRLGGLMPALAKADVRMTMLLYPRHVLDENYTATKLGWLLERYAIPRERFEAAHRNRRRVSLIHHHELLPELMGGAVGASLRTVPSAGAPPPGPAASGYPRHRTVAGWDTLNRSR